MLSTMGVGRPDGQSSLRQLALTHPAETLTMTKCAVESVTFDFFSFSENLLSLRWLRIDFIETIATAEDIYNHMLTHIVSLKLARRDGTVNGGMKKSKLPGFLKMIP